MGAYGFLLFSRRPQRGICNNNKNKNTAETEGLFQTNDENELAPQHFPEKPHRYTDDDKVPEKSFAEYSEKCHLSDSARRCRLLFVMIAKKGRILLPMVHEMVVHFTTQHPDVISA